MDPSERHDLAQSQSADLEITCLIAWACERETSEVTRAVFMHLSIRGESGCKAVVRQSASSRSLSQSDRELFLLPKINTREPTVGEPSL